MKDGRTISVVMCTYNGVKFVEEQIESIIGQTYPIYELIIQDDHSMDGTWEVLQGYQRKYPFVKVYMNESGKGVNQNFFSAFYRATGDFIAISDQDDIWEPHKLEWQVQTIGDAWLSAGITKPSIEEADITAKAYFDSRILNICLERMIYSAMIAGYTMMLKRELLEKLLLLEDWMEYYMYDHFIQIVAGAYEKISYVHKVLVNQRKHIESATYTAPLNYERSIRNIYNSVCRTYRQYQTIRPKMEKYFEHTYELLRSIPVENSSLRNGMRLALYQKDLSHRNFICLVLQCVRLRNKIFHSTEKNIFFSVLGAIYFPVSCSDYFRYSMYR